MLDGNTGDLVPLAQVPSHLELALLAMQGRGRWSACDSWGIDDMASWGTCPKQNVGYLG
jgi:hypothetical protein